MSADHFEGDYSTQGMTLGIGNEKGFEPPVEPEPAQTEVLRILPPARFAIEATIEPRRLVA